MPGKSEPQSEAGAESGDSAELLSALRIIARVRGISKLADEGCDLPHDANWMPRMILRDGLQVMASLAEREGLRG